MAASMAAVACRRFPPNLFVTTITQEKLFRCHSVPFSSLLNPEFYYIESFNHVIQRRRSSSESLNPKVSPESVKSRKEHFNVGTIGHVDHGKTTLTAAITKILARNGTATFRSYEDIDNAPMEKARGITINASHIVYATQLRHYAHTDCPGHADFMKNMICGASQLDGAVLVVDANDGPMPQTKEHLQLVRQLGLKHIVVFLNKVDKADSEVVELSELEIRDLLASYGWNESDIEVVCGSALLALEGDKSDIGEPSVCKLLNALDKFPSPQRDISSPLLLPVESAINIKGRGVVVIGTIKQGMLEKDMKVDALGFGHKLTTTVGDIHIFHQSVPRAHAGDHVGLLLRNVKKYKLQRGTMIAAKDYLALKKKFNASVYFLTKEEGGRHKPVTSNYCQQFFCETWNCPVRLDLEEGAEMIMPGENSDVLLTLLNKMAVASGQRFTIRENNKAVATGVITKIIE